MRASVADSQFPNRTPSFFTPLTRRMPAASSRLSKPDMPAPRRSKCVPVQTGKERLLDHLDTRNVIAEKFCEGDSH
jgi:hypothetical protein